MEAHAGDKIVIEGHRLGQPRRSGRIVEVRGRDDHPPTSSAGTISPMTCSSTPAATLNSPPPSFRGRM